MDSHEESKSLDDRSQQHNTSPSWTDGFENNHFEASEISANPIFNH